MKFSHYFNNPWTRHLLKAALSIGMVLYLIQVVDLQRLIEPLQMASWQGVCASTAFVIIGVVLLQALEVHYSMPADKRIPVLKLGKINLTLMFYVLFMPAGVTFLIRWDKYRRAGYGGFDSAALVGFHKILQLVVAAIVCALALMFTHDSLGPYGTEIAIAIAISFVLPVAGLLLMISGHGSNQVLRLLDKLRVTNGSPVSAWRGKLTNGLERVVNKLGQAFGTFGDLGPRNTLLVISFACLQHLFIVLSTWVVVAMVDPSAPFLATAFVRSLVVILLTVPISVGGLGVRELAFFTLFPLFGVAAESALTASLILLGVQLIVSAMGAAVEVSDWLRPKLLP